VALFPPWRDRTIRGRQERRSWRVQARQSRVQARLLAEQALVLPLDRQARLESVLAIRKLATWHNSLASRRLAERLRQPRRLRERHSRAVRRMELSRRLQQQRQELRNLTGVRKIISKLTLAKSP
jgi:hypothetical protein